MNKIIRAINSGQENPCTDNQECINFYNNVLEEKKRTGAYFSLVEPDYYEEKLLMSNSYFAHEYYSMNLENSVFDRNKLS